jgi:hypothetical protein
VKIDLILVEEEAEMQAAEIVASFKRENPGADK